MLFVKPHVAGIDYLSQREAGRHLQYTFVFVSAEPDDALRELLAALVAGHEVSFAEPGPDDCYLEARRTDAGFEIKRGCHGAYGIWRPASIDEALRWLLPGARAIATDSQGRGSLDFHQQKAETQKR
jgi:hypothetical protein